MPKVSIADAWLAHLSPIPDELRALALHLDAAAAGDAGSKAEILDQLALYARLQGLKGRPASLSLTPFLPLFRLLQTEHPDLSESLLLVFVDAHASGLKEAALNAVFEPLSQQAPVLAIGDDVVFGRLMGPMRSENIDPLLGRCLRFSVGLGAKELVLDISAAEKPNALFYRTLASLEELDHPLERITVVSPNAPEASSDRLSTRIHWEPRLQTVLDRVLDTLRGQGQDQS